MLAKKIVQEFEIYSKQKKTILWVWMLDAWVAFKEVTVAGFGNL